MTTTGPATRHEWGVAAVCLGILAACLVVIGHVGDVGAAELVARAAAAFALGVVAAAGWWALLWLRHHGLDVDPTRGPPPDDPGPAS